MMPGPFEMIIIGVVAVMLFGKRLPEVGRSLGKSLMEFKRGMSGIQEEFTGMVDAPVRSSSAKSSSTASAATFNDIDDRDEATAPKFTPPKSAPREGSTSAA